ncbi:DUF397 domain-containing protein [Streptomyces sp. MN03-5084-2B]|nr:DUF397 domain-containing protein [Streptomyces sp. MN03-5084-2B]
MAEQDGQPVLETDPLSLTWVKSSASGEGGDPACVEVARTATRVHVRDSKQPGPALSFGRQTWRAFLFDCLD